MSKTSTSSNSSRPSLSDVRDVEIQQFLRQSQTEYPLWWTRERFSGWLHSLPEDTMWNSFVCVVVLLAIVWVIVDDEDDTSNFDVDVFFRNMSSYILTLDVIYNVVYLFHVAAIAYGLFFIKERGPIGYCTKAGFVIDIFTFLHYINIVFHHKHFKLACYYLRLHRPFKYLWQLNDYNLKGSILGTTLKYCYIFFVLRVTWAFFWVHVDTIEREHNYVGQHTALSEVQMDQKQGHFLGNTTSNSSVSASQFLIAMYIVNKMFIPIGPSVAPRNDIERIACLMVMMTGCLVVTGAAVASLSLVIGIHMGPEETFRARYRLIMQMMKESNIPPSLREKVETFYKMYWHKQRAVSATQLLPTFPPTLPTTIYTDIYFAATQKSRLLCDLSYQFLSEVAKKMNTIHYIPGDTIIKRSSRKSSIIYIAYGDIEMLSAEDDSTAMVRMTRGTAVAGCAGNPAAACARAHVDIRAATFCTAHALHAPDLWRVALKYGRNADQTQILLASFDEHFERVKRHYYNKFPENVKHKSSILHFKRNLMALKEAKDSEGKLLLDRKDIFLEIAGSYIMRNRADGSQTDDADAICLRSTFPCILQPSSSLQIAWQSFMCCVILIVCFTHPYYLVFKKTVPMEFRIFDYVVTALYVIDLIVHLSTGANVEDGVPITFTQTSSQQMRSQWFALDVLGTMPIFEFVQSGHYAGINKLLRLPKVFRVLKSMEEMCVYNSNLIRFMSFTLMLIIACYLIASLQQGFMCFQFNYCLVSNFTHPPYWENGTLDEETVMNRLTFGLYWAISMITFTTHMEPFGVENWHSLLHTLVVLEICIVLHIFIESVYSATIIVTTALREDYDSCIANVKDSFIRNEVDEQLRQRFITYLQLCWYTDKAYSMTNRKTSIFFDLPPHVYQDIVTRKRSKYLLSIPFMKFLKREDLKDVSSKAKLFYTNPNEILLNTGDIINEIYLIKQGICEIVDPETKEVVGSHGVKSHFGVLECLLRIPAYYTVRAVTHLQVFTISTKVLDQVMLLPQVKDAIEFAKEQPEFRRLAVHRVSFLRYEPPERPPNMERFRLPRKYEEDYAFLHPFNRMGYFSILRYIFPRYSIRPDGTYLFRYEWCRAACALLSAIVFPSYTYLVLQWPRLYWLTLLLDFSAYFDVAQRMLVGYFNEHGVLVYHPSSTAAHYLKSAFFADILGCLPMENLESPYREAFQDKYRLTQSRQLLMLNRLLQLYRLPSAIKNLGSKIERRDILLVLQAIPLLLALLNALTCLMVFNSVNIFRSADSDSWLIVPLPDLGGSWVNLFSKTFRFNLTETPWNLHLATHFWVVYETTTTGYNSFNPSNFQLMQILFVGMVIGAMFTTYFSVRIISIRANVNKELAAYQEHIKDILVFMRRENLDQVLQKEVMSYYEYNWEKMGGVDYTNILKLCDQITLRTDAIQHIYGPTFAECPLLSKCDVSLLRMLGRAVRSLYFLRDMYLVEEDDVIRNIYFVDYGTIAVKVMPLTDSGSTSSIDSEHIATLTRGSVFGNLENATTVRCPVSFVARCRTHVLRIDAAAFRHIISDFPQVAATMQKYRQQNESYIKGSAREMKKINPSLAAMLFKPRKGLKYLYFNDKIVQLYLIIVCWFCIYADLYNAGFQHNGTLLIIVLYALDVLFYMKILMQYSLPYIMPADMKSALLPIRRSYFKKEFKYDIMSCLPLELISLACGRYKWMAFSNLRLNRLLRIVTLYKCLKKRQSRITINLTLNTVFSVLVWFTLFIHTATCLWHFISLLEDNATPHSSWIYNDTGGSQCHNHYVCSTYFILTTFTQNGVGDILPKNRAEVMFVSILQIISTLLYMVYVGEFSNIIQFQSFRSFSFYCKYMELQEFLKNNRVSKNLVTSVNQYTLHLWRECRGMQVPHFLQTAPQALKLSVMSAAFMRHLQKNPVFKDCEPTFLRQLVGCLQLYTYNEDMYVVKELEITDAMYLIHTGRVLETSAATGDRKTYTPSECFGVEQGLIYDHQFVFSYQTITKSQVLTLKLHDWEYLLDHFPESKKTVYDYTQRSDFPPKGRKTMDRGKGMDDGPPRVLPPSADQSPQNEQQSMSSPPAPSPPPSPSPSSPPSPSPSSPPSPPPPPPPSQPSSSPPVDYNFAPMAGTSSGPTTSTAPTDIPLTELASTKETIRADSPKPSTSSQTALKSDLPGPSKSKTSLDEKATELSSRSPSGTSNIPTKMAISGIPPIKRVFDVEPAVPTTSKMINEPSSVTPKDQTLPLTEPIVTQSYTNVPLEITELPPSLTKITPGIPSTTSDMMINEAFDLDADNDLKTEEEAQFIWPLESKHSAETHSGELIDKLDRVKSTQSLQDSRDKRGPRDVDDALRSSKTLIDKVETRAKKLFGRKKSELDYVPSNASSDKDLLLLEEDEEATSALLHQIERHSRVESNALDRFKKDNADEITEIVTPDETQLDYIKSDLFDVQSQPVKPTDGEALAVVLHDPPVASTSKHSDVGDEEPTPITHKKSVHYKEGSPLIRDRSKSDSESILEDKQPENESIDKEKKKSEDDTKADNSSDKKVESSDYKTKNTDNEDKSRDKSKKD